MERPYIAKLANGMQLVFLENHRYPWVELLGVAKVGAMNEDDEHDGLSHFLEHLLFKGTEKRSTGKLAEDVTAIGGMFNAMTNHCWTCYTIGVPPERVLEGIEIHTDQIQNSTLPEDEVNRERSVVQEEIRISLDNPIRYNMEKVLKLIFEKHPLRRTVLGSHDLIGSVPRDRIYNYYRSHYVPNNMAYIVVGDFRTEEIFPVLEENWGGLKVQEVKIPDLSEPQQTQPRFNVLHGKIDQSVAAYGTRIPGMKDPDYYALQVINSYLTEGRSSRLYQRLITEEKLAWQLYAYEECIAEDGYLTINAFCGKDSDPLRVQSIMMEEIHRLKITGPTDSELESAKNRVLAGKARFEETYFMKAISLAEDFAKTDFRKEDEFRKRIRALDRKQIIGATRAHLSLGHEANWSFYLPEESKTIVPVLTDKKLWDADRCEKTVHELENGLRVVLIPDQSLNMVYSSMIALPGTAIENPPEAGITNLALSSMLQGTVSHTGGEFDRAAAAIGAEFNINVSAEFHQAGGSVLPENIEQFIDLYYELITEPEMTDKVIEATRATVLKEIQARHDFPMWYAFNKAWEVLYGRKGYGLPHNGLIETVSGMTSGIIREYLKGLLNPFEAVLIFAGDIEPDDLLKKVEARFGNLPFRKPAERPVEEFAVDKELIETKEQFQTIIIVLAPGLPQDHEDLPALTIVNEMLGGAMSARLFKNLRDKEGLAYAVHSRNVSHFGTGGLMAYIGTSPEKEEQALEGMFREIIKPGSEGFTEDEFQQAKSYFDGCWKRMGEKPVMVFNRDYAPLLFGKDEDFSEKFHQAVMKTSLKQANEAAAKYLKREKLYTFTYRAIQPEDPEERINA
jgi:zinc protease